MDSVLRPRDIQARIRSGESPESVAAAAQTTVEKIIPFATPVLAERAYVAEQAQKASVRRRAGDGHVANLAGAVAERLESDDLDPDSVQWDAWRREDGRWTLVAAYRRGPEPVQARFVYDQAGRYVTAEDDAARRLVGERVSGAAASPGPAARAGEQLPLGADALEVVTGRRVEPEAPAPVSSDWISTQASERPAEPERAPAEEPEAPATLFDAPEQPAAVTEPAVAEREPEPEQASEQQAEPPAARPKKAGKGRARASVPSWDEIMFGSQRGE